MEVPRETGRRYFVGGGATASTPAAGPDVGRYFVAVQTDRVPVERPRETGEREFGPPDRSLDGYDYNLSDLRADTGCWYFSGQPCVDVTADHAVRPPPPDRCPSASRIIATTESTNTNKISVSVLRKMYSCMYYISVRILVTGI